MRKEKKGNGPVRHAKTKDREGIIAEVDVTHVKNVVVSFKTIIMEKSGHVSLTEWPNGDGYDIEIVDGDSQTQYQFQLTTESWRALMRAMNVATGKTDENGRRLR